MRKILFYISFIAIASALVVSCDDGSSTLGGSLIEDKVEVVMDSAFTVEGNSVAVDSVISRTITQLLGRIDAEGYGSFSSDIVTQFMPGLSLDTEKLKREDVDSVKLIMQMTNGCYTGDSVTPMGVKVYPLTKVLQSPIYSDFDPVKEKCYDSNALWGSTIYAANALGASDSVQKLKSRKIEVMLPHEFALKIYDQYKNDNSVFQSPQAFAQWFPGLYITNSFGSGRVTRIDKSFITLYYHIHDKSSKTGNDTTLYYSNTYMAVTPEIVTNNNISYHASQALTSRVAGGEALLVAPSGYNVSIKFPGKALVERYRATAGPVALLNALSFELPVEEIANDYGINPPTSILLVKKSLYSEFFVKNQVTDGVNSFVATYDATNRRYVFSDMRSYLETLLAKDAVADEDEEFIITPVHIVTEQSTGTYTSTSVMTGIVPYVINPVMARLKLDQAKVKMIFSKQVVSL